MYDLLNGTIFSDIERPLTTIYSKRVNDVLLIHVIVIVWSICKEQYHFHVFERHQPIFQVDSMWRWISQKRYEIQCSYNEILIGVTHALLKSVTSNDLEWLSEMFNDTTHRAVFLQQLNFLLSVLYIRLATMAHGVFDDIGWLVGWWNGSREVEDLAARYRAGLGQWGRKLELWYWPALVLPSGECICRFL